MRIQTIPLVVIVWADGTLDSALGILGCGEEGGPDGLIVVGLYNEV
jgi:hypothetical protein